MDTLPKQDAATPPTDSNIKLIPLTQGKFAIVDAADFDWLNQWKWYAAFFDNGNHWYAMRGVRDPKTKKRHSFFMHRVIMQAQSGVKVDHQDRYGLNNSRTNLRLCTTQQNACNRIASCLNTSGHKGVSWVESRGKWRARIRVKGKRISLGSFTVINDAANAYAEAARRLHGEFART